MKVRALILTVAAIANSAIAQDYQDYADGYEQDNLYQDYANKQQEQGGGGGWVFVYMLLLGLCIIHTTDILTSLQNEHHTKSIQRWTRQINWCLRNIIPYRSQGPLWPNLQENENKTPQRSKGIIYSILQRCVQVGRTKSRAAGCYWATSGCLGIIRMKY